MPEIPIALITSTAGGIAIVVAAYLTFRSSRSANRTKATEVETQAAVEMFQSNLELTKYVDERVAAAIQPAMDKIAALEERVAQLTTREGTTKDIVRRFFQRLLWWDERGRKGPMPMPSPEDMAVLDIVDIQADTLTATEVAELRAHKPKE